jgi:NAD(P)-dependent dehydrogenase (short-subunit alcohol dehydrogenase family)
MTPDFTGEPLSRLWSLDGRVAVVTGGGSGMGQATALRLAEAGAAVAVADIVAAKAQETADLIAERSSGARALPLTVDVTDPASVHALGDAVTERLGPVDIWVNTAWLSSSGGIADYSDEMWRQGIGVNLDGSFYTAREAAQRMLAAGRRGVIILVTSGSAHHGRARRYQYVAAKHGTLGLVRSLALELGPAGIRVVAIAPAATDTPGYRAAPARFSGPDAEQAKRLLDDTIAKMALGRLAQADDIARAAVFAASDMAGFITGSTIHVDGGVDAT